jgi:hypothetical protein
MTHKAFKGEIMRKQYMRFLIALIGVASLGVAAKAQGADQIVVKIPYEFVAAGKTLPAGNYTVRRVSDLNEGALVLNNSDNHESIIVVAQLVESRSTDKGSVSLEQVGDQFFLSGIKTADHVFTVSVSHSAVLEAEAKSHGGTSASGGSSGSN